MIALCLQNQIQGYISRFTKRHKKIGNRFSFGKSTLQTSNNKIIFGECFGGYDLFSDETDFSLMETED